MTSPEVKAHIAAGRALRAVDLNGFVREAGSGEPVVCVHGVPTSSYLYRKVLEELAARGLRGVAFDLPGLGLADRPRVLMSLQGPLGAAQRSVSGPGHLG